MLGVKQGWKKLSLMRKLIVMTLCIIILVGSSMVFTLVVMKTILNEHELNMYQNSICYELQKAIQDETEKFLIYTRESSTQSRLDLEDAMAITKLCVEELPLHAWMEDKNLVVTISDDGQGMTEERLNAVRQSLEEKEDLGRGIGLGNISRRIRMLYENGKFEIESQINKGTKIIITIPQEAAAEEAFEDNIVDIRLSLARETIENYIKAHYMDDISMHNLARVMNYSDAHFCKLFKVFGSNVYVCARVNKKRGLCKRENCTDCGSQTSDSSYDKSSARK